MIIAADYPFMDIFWSMIIFFAWVAWIWVLVMIVMDLFRRHDTSGWVKAGWVILVIVLPFIGVLAYLIINGQGMGRRGAEQAQQAQQQFDSYVKDVAGGGGTASELEKAKGLLDSGAITQSEFDALKAKLLG